MKQELQLDTTWSSLLHGNLKNTNSKAKKLTLNSPAMQHLLLQFYAMKSINLSLKNESLIVSLCYYINSICIYY